MGEACVQKVAGALKGVEGVTTQSVQVGTANIKSDQAGCQASCAAIGGAGFKAHEAKRDTGDMAAPAGDTPVNAAPNSGAAKPGAPAMQTTVKASSIPAAPAR